MGARAHGFLDFRLHVGRYLDHEGIDEYAVQRYLGNGHREFDCLGDQEVLAIEGVEAPETAVLCDLFGFGP